MAQILTTGGGVSFTSDGKKLTKQVYVLTGETTTVTPTNVQGAVITSADFVQEVAGTMRVTVTWTQGQSAGSGTAGVAAGGKTIELIGGSRELPVESHPSFKSVSDEALKEIKTAIQEGRNPDAAIVPTTSGNKGRILYKLLLRGTEFYLAPSVSLRETTMESAMPGLREIATINAPTQSPQVTQGQNWLLTSINARSVAQPTGGVLFEVSREWMLSDRNGWDLEKVLYNGT